MGERTPRNYFSVPFNATNRPRTCLWCGGDTTTTFIDTGYSSPPDPALFCSIACAADFGENLARRGARIDPRPWERIIQPGG